MSFRLTTLVRLSLAGACTLLLAGLMLPAQGMAAEHAEEGGESSGFSYQVDPLDAEVLFRDVDTNSSKFEEYRDMSSGPLVRRVRIFGESRDRNRVFDVDFFNVGRDDARYTTRYRKSGSYAVKFDYNIIPHAFGNDGTLLHSSISGPGIYSISDTTQATLQSAVEAQLAGGGAIDFAFLESQLRPFINSASQVDTRLDRERAHVQIDIGKLSPLAWRIDLRHERREGTRPYGGTFGFSNAIELPEPIRYDTATAEVAGEWTASRGGLRFGVNVSAFNNDVETLLYDNFWRITDSTDSTAYASPGTRSIGGPSIGRNALAPDNEAQHVFFGGHARLGQRGWLNGNLTFGTMEQDATLLAHTINSAINTSVADASIRPPFDASDPANLPRATADQEVDILHFTANAGTRFNDWSSVKFRARYYDYDNKTAPFVIPGYVRMDAVWEQIPRTTVPYSYTNQKVGVEFGFDPTRKTHVGVGYDLLSWDRDFREVDSSDEDIFHITVDSRAIDRVMLSGGWERGDRTVDRYNVAAQLDTFTDPNSEVNNQFGLRKYDQAEREYDALRASATIFATDTISITLGASAHNVDYPEFVLVPDATDPDPTRPTLPLVVGEAMGLLEEEIFQYNAEIAYTPHERFTFFVFGSRTDRETFQRARQSGGTVSFNPLDTWELTLSEVTDTWGLGLTGRINPRWSVSLNGSWSDSDGDSIFFTPTGGNPASAVSFAEYDDNEWLVYSLGFRFHASERLEAGISLIRDEYITNRFQRNNLDPYLPGTLILDLEDGDYDADMIIAHLRLRF